MSSNIGSFIHKLGSPRSCYRFCRTVQPWLMLVCVTTFLYGLIDGLGFAPTDYQQGDAYRILFIHVPAAILSLAVYAVMTAAMIIFLIWKIKVADVVAKVSAPIGALFTVLTLVTGSLWGKPMWGTFWIWDARLTSELILLFIYFGIIVLRQSIPEPFLAARASGLVTLIGAVNIPIVHYSVVWWNTLHQGATILKWSAPSIAPSMLHPLLIMIIAYFAYYFWMLAAKIRSEILMREKNTVWVKEVVG